jgi:MFS superfamily sulfate permease-like transporter
VRLGGNTYDRAELAGAFGDLGTLVPFVVGYVTLVGLDAQGVLLGFGLVAVATGLYFRTPLSVQPMKAIGTAAIAHPASVTPGMVWASALVTGFLWLGLAATGAVAWLAALTSRPVVRGLVLGLGLSFVLEGVRLMQQGWIVGVVGAALTFVLLGHPRVPAMLVLLGYGALVALTQDPSLGVALAAMAPHPRLPALAVTPVSWPELARGAVLLALPQAALTLGNAVIAAAAEHNRLFPHRPITVRGLAWDHGVMNLAAAALGGVPMCRGAGGMAGHVRFGARTGGALVILGTMLLAVALLLPDSIGTLFRLFPAPVLGVILLFGGLELAASVTTEECSPAERTVLAVTAGLALWNMGAAYFAGLALHHAAARGWIRL